MSRAGKRGQGRAGCMLFSFAGMWRKNGKSKTTKFCEICNIILRVSYEIRSHCLRTEVLNSNLMYLYARDITSTTAICASCITYFFKYIPTKLYLWQGSSICKAEVGYFTCMLRHSAGRCQLTFTGFLGKISWLQLVSEESIAHLKSDQEKTIIRSSVRWFDEGNRVKMRYHIMVRLSWYVYHSSTNSHYSWTALVIIFKYASLQILPSSYLWLERRCCDFSQSFSWSRPLKYPNRSNHCPMTKAFKCFKTMTSIDLSHFSGH